MGDRAIIDRLAESIADGGTVDWAAAASDARTEHERDLIARLRRIGDVADRGRHAAHTPHSAAGTAVAPSRGPEPARHWGHLSILEPVGKGAFGEVYRARDPKLARDVALKLLRESSSTSDAGAEVIEEGRLLARLRHPNVATVYGADRLDGYVGIWMEFINGRTLEQVLAEHGPFGADEAARIGIDLCRALGAVHQAGLVHRDVKAQNVMREDDGGRLVLMDFGTGREREQQPDAAANLSGTPLYLAPEVFGGDAATIQSDIYSLGVLLHHLVTGSYPVTARTLGALAAAHKGKVRTPLRTARPDLPPPFVDIVDRATAPAAHLRWANAQELESALAGTLARPQTNGPSEMVDRSGVGRRRRRQERNAYRALVTAVVIAVVILIAGGVWVFRERSVVPVGPRALVLVADFDNTTDVPNLGQSVKAWLEQELANSRVVDNVPTVRINDQLKLMVRDPEERITPALAREICERDGGIHRYITGAAAPVGARYILTASLFAPDGREVGNAREVAASQEELIPSIQRLAGRIRELAGESRAEITQADQDALRVTTPSLEAYRLYRLAYTRRDKQDWEKSQALIDQALQYDREFPSAHIWRAWALWHAYKDRGLNTKDEAEAEATRARDLRDNASPWERLWIEGSYGSITGKLELAAAAYKALLDLYPTHDWAVGNLENVTGRLNRPFEALPYATSAADLRPYDRLAVEEAAFATLEAGDTSRARQYMERLRGIRANSANAINAAEVGIVEAWAAWKRGEAKEARGLLDPIVPALSLSGWTIRGGAGVRGSVVRLYLALGRPTDAKRVATSPFSASLVSYWQEDDEMLRSSLPAKLSFDKPAEDQMAPEEWTIMLLQAGNLGEAERRVDFAFRQAPPSGGSSFLAVLKARLLRSHNDDAGALKLLLTTSATAEPSPLYVADRADILADLRIEQGKNQDALETLRAAKWNSATSDCYTPLLGMKNLARLAGLERQFGKVTEADQIDAELRRLLTEAEPDFPLARRLGEKAAHK